MGGVSVTDASHGCCRGGVDSATDHDLFHSEEVAMEERVAHFLKENDVVFQLVMHEAVFTCEDAHDVRVAGTTLKNLFVHDKAHDRFYLVTLPAEKRLDMKRLQEIAGSKRLSFGKAEDLLEKLGIEPGSVSPLCLLNNLERDVKFFIDRAGWEAETVNIHPNENTASLVLDRENFHRLVNALGAEIEIYE